MDEDAPAIPVVTGDRPIPDDAAPARLPVVLVLDRLRSAFNVGNIFRLADVCNLQAVYTCGYTATPPHPKLQKTAMGTDQVVPCRHFDQAADACRELAAAGYHVLAVETVADAPDAWQAPMPLPLALVFGNEALGVQPETLAACHAYTRLPVLGVKNSLNVSNCAAVLCYEVLRRQRQDAG